MVREARTPVDEVLEPVMVTDSLTLVDVAEQETEEEKPPDQDTITEPQPEEDPVETEGMRPHCAKPPRWLIIKASSFSAGDLEAALWSSHIRELKTGTLAA